MSAWILDKRHIDLLVTAAVDANMTDEEEADIIGTLLWSENHASYNYRYNESYKPDEYKFERYHGKPKMNIPRIFKAVHCYEYRSCEHPGWVKSDAHEFCVDLVRYYAHAVDGYDAAAWSIDNRPE